MNVQVEVDVEENFWCSVAFMTEERTLQDGCWLLGEEKP